MARPGPIEKRIGISTHFLPTTHGEDIFDAIKMVSKAGFAGFEIVPTLDQAQIGFPENYPNVGIDLFEASDDEVARLQEALGTFDWVTIHAPHLDWNLASANRHLRRLTWQYFDRCFELGVQLGARAVTYHNGGATKGYIRSQKRIWDYNVEYARHLMPRAKEAGMPVGFEAGTLEQLKYVCDRVEGWGIHLDIGHAWMHAGSDQGFLAYIDEFRDRIVEIHNNGVNHYWGRYMEHQPASLNNTVDLRLAYRTLAEVGYQGPIVCEIQGNDILQVIKHCQEYKELIIGITAGTAGLSQRWNAPP